MAVAINPSDPGAVPGASTQARPGGFRWGRNRIDEGVKGALSLGMVPPLSDHSRYDLLAQEALRGVVRRVLGDVARNGLPGEHHFYVTFGTGAPGVKISDRLRAEHPDEMTIVLQHQFWDLEVTDQAFEVGL